jgi:MFS family permease
MAHAVPAPPGFRLTVACLSVGQILSWAALYYAFSSLVLPMQRELHWDKATMMGALTLGLGVWGATTFAAGTAIDRGHGRALMSTGSLLAAAGFVGWSFISQPWMLYAVWAVLGAAMAMTLYEPAFNVLTKRYPRHYREGITALTLVGGFASTLAFPAMAALIAWLGWRDALLAVAAALGLGVTPLHLWVLRGPAVVAAAHADDPQDDATLREAMHAPAFWLLALSFTFYSFATAALWAHVMPVFASKGLDELQATAVLVWVGPAQVLGRLIYAWAGRGMSLRVLGMAVLLGMPASLVLLALSRQTLPLLLFALLFGLANGLVTIVRGALVPEYFGRSHIGRIGGAMSAVGLLARAAAPLISAWMLLFMTGYTQVLLALSALGFGAVAAFALARPPQRQR